MKNTLLAMTSGGSLAGYEGLKDVSQFCALILPITGVLSFVILVIVNWDKLTAFFTRKHKKNARGKGG